MGPTLSQELLPHAHWWGRSRTQLQDGALHQHRELLPHRHRVGGFQVRDRKDAQGVQLLPQPSGNPPDPGHRHLAHDGIGMAGRQRPPASNIGDGTRPAAPTATADDQKEPTLDELWDRVVAAFDAAVEAAREDPETAKKLYDFALYGLGNRGSGNGIREAFTELKIPLDFLSHTDNGDPFA